MALQRGEAILEIVYVERQVFCHLIVKACSVLHTLIPKHFRYVYTFSQGVHKFQILGIYKRCCCQHIAYLRTVKCFLKTLNQIHLKIIIRISPSSYVFKIYESMQLTRKFRKSKLCISNIIRAVHQIELSTRTIFSI